MRKKVLVIEQNFSLGFALKNILSDCFKVVVVPNAFDGMNELSQKRFECIILSVEHKTGRPNEFLCHLNSSSLLKNIPLIVICNCAYQEVKRNFEKDNVIEIFKKPFDPLRILNTVKGICNHVDTSQVLTKKNKLLNLN